MERELRSAVYMVTGLAFVHVLAILLPPGLTWGFHEFHFLPVGFLFLYLLLIGLAIILTIRRTMLQVLTPAAELMERRPVAFLLVTVFLLTCCAIWFRVRVPLLGDSFYIIKNYFEAFRGIAPLYPRNEPLATYFFSIVLGWQDISTYQKFLDGFLIADLLLGMGFILNVFGIIRLAVTDPMNRFLGFVFLLAFPYVQLFFGYVEVYAVVLFALSLYLLILLLCFQGKLPFFVPAITFLFLVLVHYLSLLLLPSLVYLAIIEYQRKGMRPIVPGVAAGIIIIVGLLVGINFEYERFSSWVPHSHVLSLAEPTDPVEVYSQPYTLLSMYHFIDLANYLILMAPGAIFLLVVGIRAGTTALWKDDIVRILLLAGLPVFAFWGVVKYDLGAARDWDVFASFFLIVGLLSFLIFVTSAVKQSHRIILLICMVTLINSMVYWYVNSSVEPTIARYKSLLDRRVMSQGNYYGAILQLSLYYHQVKNYSEPVALWNQYVGLFPDDDRGYAGIINNIRRNGEGTHEIILTSFERWRTAAPHSELMKEKYSGYCLETGNEFYQRDDLVSAANCYERILLLDPARPKAFNNLGSVYAQQRQYRRAIEMFHRAIDLDSSYADAYYNLGNAYIDSGDPSSGITCMRQSAQLGNSIAQRELQDRRLTW